METLLLRSSETFNALQLLRHAAPRLAGDFAGLGAILFN